MLVVVVEVVKCGVVVETGFEYFVKNFVMDFEKEMGLQFSTWCWDSELLGI